MRLAAVVKPRPRHDFETGFEFRASRALARALVAGDLGAAERWAQWFTDPSAAMAARWIVDPAASVVRPTPRPAVPSLVSLGIEARR